MGLGAAIGGGASLLGGLFSSSAADDAAQAQAQAQQAAIAEQRRQYDQTRTDLGGYRDAGAGATNMLMGRLGELTAPWSPTQASLEATPGYSFTLGQGLKSVQNSAAARGLGISGAALKGAANYATGLADSTWQNVFSADQTQRTNAYNKLMGVAGLGENAAARTGTAGTAAADQIGQSYSNIGSADAAGILGSAKALTGGLNGATGNLLTYGMLNQNSGGVGGLFSSAANNLSSNTNLLMNAGYGNDWSIWGPGGSL